MFLDQAYGAVDVLGCLGMERNDVGTRLGEIGNDAIDRFHHQVHVDRGAGERPDRSAYERADRQVRHIMIVHHIEMDQVCTRRDDVIHFLAQAREVGGQNAGCNAIHDGEPDPMVAAILP